MYSQSHEHFFVKIQQKVFATLKKNLNRTQVMII
jgi:hypothetical protein